MGVAVARLNYVKTKLRVRWVRPSPLEFLEPIRGRTQFSHTPGVEVGSSAIRYFCHCQTVLICRCRYQAKWSDWTTALVEESLDVSSGKVLGGIVYQQRQTPIIGWYSETRMSEAGSVTPDPGKSMCVSGTRVGSSCGRSDKKRVCGMLVHGQEK